MTVEIITFQDYFYLNSAVELAELAAAEASKPGPLLEKRHSACVIGAVVCSTAFLECTVNGLYEDSKSFSRPTKFHKALSSVWSDAFERLPVLSKYQVALTLAKCDIFRIGEEPYQSAEALIELRNAIAHPKEILGSQKNQQRLEKRLHERYTFASPREHRKEFFPERCLSAYCATWATRAAINFAMEFKRKLPPTAYFFGAQHGLTPTMLKRLDQIEKGLA